MDKTGKTFIEVSLEEMHRDKHISINRSLTVLNRKMTTSIIKELDELKHIKLYTTRIFSSIEPNEYGNPPNAIFYTHRIHFLTERFINRKLSELYMETYPIIYFMIGPYVGYETWQYPLSDNRLANYQNKLIREWIHTEEFKNVLILEAI